LSSSTQDYLQQQASLHITQSENDSAQLADSGNTDGALAVQSDLEARLSAHAKLLAVLGERLQAHGDATTTGQVALFLESVSKDRSRVSLSREESEGVASSTTGSSTPSEQAKIAFYSHQDAERHTEEAHLFAQHASILALLPPTTTTASTTSTTTPFKNKHNRGEGKDDNATSTSATTTPADD
jgi:hypothetical protein